MMNAQVQEFLNIRNVSSEERKRKRREKHLIKLGLIQENKIILDEWDGSANCKYDNETGKYIKGTVKAIDVTDEEYAEICKVCPEDEEKHEQTETEAKAENILNIIATLYLAAGIILGVLLLVAGISGEGGTTHFLWAVVCLLNSSLVWALLRCFANISTTLTEIKKQMHPSSSSN